MIPVLHRADAIEWNSFGIGALADTISCEVEENRNGSYELEMTYPVTGVHFSDIAIRTMIVAKPNFTDSPQPFRVYRISKPINGTVTIYARHLCYDLSGYVDAPFSAIGIQQAIVTMLNNTYVRPQNCPFFFYSDITSTKAMTTKEPTSVRALMGGIDGSLIDLYGGEWSYDGYECKLNAHRGSDRGVTIRYGKNLTELTQDENAEAIYTAVYPFYHNKQTDELITLTEKTIPVIDDPEFDLVYPLDLTEKFQAIPTESQVRTAAQAYIDANDLATPKVNITLDFVQAESLKDRVDLCDTVHVYFDALGVSASAKCIRTVWDVLKERYTTIEIGTARNSIAKTISEVDSKTEKAIEVVSRGVSDIASAAASKITGNMGGYVVMHDTDSDGEPDEMLMMDTDDIETATHVVRMNKNGIAFSSDGYHGTYTSAWSIDGQFVADFITAGTLSADMVTILGDSNFYWDAGNIYVMDPTDSLHQIRIGLFDGEHYGIGFTRDGGVTWQTAMDFNGLHVEATGFAKVYVQQNEPTGGTYNIGDMWIKSQTAYTWNVFRETPWNDVATYKWDDMGGEQEPNMYTWNGVNWQKTYDGESVSALSAELNIAEGRINALATTTTNLNGRVTTNETNINVMGGQLTAEITRATDAEQEAMSAIRATADSITTEVQKGLNGQGGYSSVYQTEQQVRTTVANDAYGKNTTVDISTNGVAINSTGYLTVTAADHIKIGTGTLKGELDDIEDAADTAQSTANTATAKANNAQTTANSALTVANYAQSTANTANSTATTAKSTADNIANGTTGVPKVTSSGLTIQNGDVTINGTSKITVNANKSLTFGCSASNSAMVINNDGVSIGTAKNIAVVASGSVQIGASGSGVHIDKNGVEIDTGGHLTVDSSNLEISANGTLSARNAYLSGDIYSNNFPVMTRGGDIVVSSSQPSGGHAGMIWIKPDPSTSVSSEYSHEIEWGTRLSLFSNPKSGTMSGSGVSTSWTNCSYTLNVPIYLRSHSGQPTGGKLKCVVTSGNKSITFTATVNEATTGTGDKVVQMTTTSNVWIGDANSLSFSLTAEQVSGYYVYNILNSSDTSASIALSCTATGSASGWANAEVKVYV